MQQNISIVINTYNAEQYLARVLETVKDFDEIVVCDMESTDKTLKIAEQYGCKIVVFPKRNYNICEPARNFAIQSASSVVRDYQKPLTFRRSGNRCDVRD